ncbi:hypothetical protein [Paenibacillus sp. ACRRY]|uniref:hypothetical protein n=1 Tax=Paenibacillus sp. ACRRY TaxID=2918208 RepID=UPI001EF7118F|nr:hypothetical protein [Paenibacillus sp. ACRRY]MCG7383386.1 hypothetical protein [Paenibacillus sp. ACRRY]
MSKATYASILRNSYTEDDAPDRRRALIHATFVGMVESIVNDADYTATQKITKIRNLNDARKEVLADE